MQDPDSCHLRGSEPRFRGEPPDVNGPTDAQPKAMVSIAIPFGCAPFSLEIRNEGKSAVYVQHVGPPVLVQNDKNRSAIPVAVTLVGGSPHRKGVFGQCPECHEIRNLPCPCTPKKKRKGR